MTEQEFLDALSKTTGWKLHGEYLRCEIDGRDCCPITAVEAAHEDAVNWNDAAERLGMSCGGALRIVMAADADDYEDCEEQTPGWDTDLRRRLLIACGLLPGAQS